MPLVNIDIVIDFGESVPKHQKSRNNRVRKKGTLEYLALQC